MKAAALRRRCGDGRMAVGTGDSTEERGRGCVSYRCLRRTRSGSATVTPMPHHLDWEGCFNARDLGGLRTGGGHELHRQRLIRSDALDNLTAQGWQQLWDYGVRTIIDLRNDDEVASDIEPRPSKLTTLRLPLDGIEDREFWDEWSSGPQFGTPLYFRPHLDRFPHLSAQVAAAIADAPPGGVLFHCSRGRDRTGLIAMVVLSSVGVPPQSIADDYAASAERLPALFAARDEQDQGPAIAAFLQARGLTPRQALLAALESFSGEEQLRRSGLPDDQIMRLRRRLLDGA